MEHDGRTAIIAGATGLVGSRCLEALLDSPSYGRIVALVRRPLDVSHSRLVVHTVCFDSLSIPPEAVRADDVFCCLGTTMKVAGSQEAFRMVDGEFPRSLATLCSSMKCRNFVVVSSVGANPESSVFYLRVKGEMEHAIRGLPFDSIHIFRPSFLIGERKVRRRGEGVGIALARLARPLLVGPYRKYRPIDARTVARAMVRCAIGDRQGTYVHESDDIEKIGATHERKG